MQPELLQSSSAAIAAASEPAALASAFNASHGKRSRSVGTCHDTSSMTVPPVSRQPQAQPSPASWHPCGRIWQLQQALLCSAICNIDAVRPECKGVSCSGKQSLGGHACIPSCILMLPKQALLLTKLLQRMQLCPQLKLFADVFKLSLQSKKSGGHSEWYKV